MIREAVRLNGFTGIRQDTGRGEVGCFHMIRNYTYEDAFSPLPSMTGRQLRAIRVSRSTISSYGVKNWFVSPCLNEFDYQGLSLRLKGRKFFDSGDYALTKVGDDSVTGHPKTGKQHPTHSRLPHLSSPAPSAGNVKSDAGASQHSPTSRKPERSSSLVKERHGHEETIDDAGLIDEDQRAKELQHVVASQVVIDENSTPPNGESS